MSKRLNGTTESISISLPGWLIDILDIVCEQKDFTRSCFAKQSIKKNLLYKIEDPELWEHIYARLMEKS